MEQANTDRFDYEPILQHYEFHIDCESCTVNPNGDEYMCNKCERYICADCIVESEYTTMEICLDCYGETMEVQ